MRDRGAATIYAAAVGLFLALAGLAVAKEGVRVVDAAQARNAADFGALAGAMRAVYGLEAACSRARQIVAANGAHLEACHLEGLDLTVTARVRDIDAIARAGPIR